MSEVWVRMRVGGEDYALAVEAVREVVELAAVTPVPGAPRGIQGVINLHGQVVPLVATAHVLGAVEDQARTARRAVVVHDGLRRAALAVDEVVDVMPAPDSIEQTGSRLVTGAAIVDRQLVGLIDLDALLGAAG